MEHQKRLAQNLSCLCKYHPDIYPLIQTSSRYEPDIETGDAGHSVSSVRSSLESGSDYFYWIGFGDGAAFDQCVDEIVSENRGVMVVEPSLEIFVSALYYHDMRKWLKNLKVEWVIGGGYETQLELIWRRSLCYAAANPLFIITSSAVSVDRFNLLKGMLDYIRIECIRRKKVLTDRIKNLPSILKDRKDGPLRVWTFDDFRGRARFSTIQSVLIRNIFHGLRNKGCQTEYTVLRDGHYYPPYYRVFKMALFEPDIIFMCNQGAAYDTALGAELSRSLPIPKVIWFADDPVYAEHLILRNKTSPEETYLVADYEWGDPLVENGAAPPQFMPGAATRTRRGKKRGSRKCELVFVGQVRDQRAFFQSLSPAWRTYCQKVIQEKLRFPRKKVREVMAQFPLPGKLEADRTDELRQKVLWEANTRFRLKVIQSLSDYDLRIYGNDAWLSLLPPKMAERCFRGLLRFKHLFEVYRNAAITLNIHSLQSYTCLNVRDFDVPASGGFLLSDWLPRAEEVFKPGFVTDFPLEDVSDQEVFFYRSPLELKKLVDYFLVHEDQRNSCIERSRQRVLAEHTYAHRADFLHELFGNIR